jgi:response regulator of citrate/malate metabolism
MKGEGKRSLAIGIDLYLLKPVNIERLHATRECWLPIQAETISLVWSSRRKSRHC